MAKSPYIKKPGGINKMGGFARIDLKQIGHAFDYVLDRLEEIESEVVDPKAVAKTVDDLQKLETSLSQLCPQFWFCDFKLKQ